MTKILIAEHDPNDIELIENELKKGEIIYTVAIVQNEWDYCNALKHFIPDIILADYTFPSFDGPTAFKIKEEIAQDTPFIFVSGTIGEDNSIELIKTGVTDYVLKDNLLTLNHKVARALKEAKDSEQKKKTEQKLLLSEKHLARAQQLAHMGSWELNFLSNFVRLSDEACRIYGLLPEQNLQTFESWLAFIHPEDVDFVLKKIKESRDSLLTFFIKYRILNKSGSIRHIYTDSKLEFHPNGKPTSLYGIAQDITETVLLENELIQERLAKQSEITSAILTAQENERAEIGKELDENLSQILGATKLYIELAKTDAIKREMLLEKSSGYIVDVMSEIMKISKTLASPGKQVGLFSSIKNLLDDLTRVHPIEVHLHVDDFAEGYPDEKLQLTIFRIVQEQVNNILKHAGATSASIRLTRHDKEILLVISDNGKGHDNTKEINGVGIKNIKSRVELHNGAVTITSNPSEGYELKVALPFKTMNVSKTGRGKTGETKTVANVIMKK